MSGATRPSLINQQASREQGKSNVRAMRQIKLRGSRLEPEAPFLLLQVSMQTQSLPRAGPLTRMRRGIWTP